MKTKLLILSFLILKAITVFGQGPSWEWAHYAGEGDFDQGRSIAVDANGNSYVTGGCDGYFPLIFGNITLTESENFAFIVKYDSIGNAIWARSGVGGSGESISVDANANVYVTGYFSGQIIVFGTDTLTSSDTTLHTDIFIVKYDSMGNVLWARSAGGANSDAFPTSIKINPNGDLFLTGYYNGPNISFGGSVLYNSTLKNNMYVVRYDSSGNVIWAKGADSANGFIVANSIAVDTNGNSYVTGKYADTVSLGSINLISTIGLNTNLDIFVVKYDLNGNVMWAKSAGGNNWDEACSIGVDGAGNAYLTGYSASLSLVFGNTTLNNSNNVANLFIAKYDAFGNLQWAKNANGFAGSINYGITVDNYGNFFITGSTGAITFDSVNIINPNGTQDVFVAKFNASGNAIWAKSTNGYSSISVANSIAIDSKEDIYITGSFRPRLTFDSLIDLFPPYNGGPWSHIFVAKLKDGLASENCLAKFFLYPDTTPHNWIIYNLAEGVYPINYLWNWGDGTTSNGATPSHTYSSPGFYNICLTIIDGLGCNKSYCDSSIYVYKNSFGTNGSLIINVNVVLQQNNVPSTPLINIFPNPVHSGKINITSTETISQLQITNTLGQLVFQSKLTEKNVQVQLNLNGIYFVKLTSNNQTFTQKIIVQQ